MEQDSSVHSSCVQIESGTEMSHDDSVQGDLSEQNATKVPTPAKPRRLETRLSASIMNVLRRARGCGRPLDCKVVMPLYIYPLKDAWQPLYQAIMQHPSVNFVVVVNPSSGPGDGALPSADYLRELPRLNNFRNVQTVGYVKVDWCRRPLSETFADIETYSEWATSGIAGIHVQGIFVDETPNHFSEDRVEYLHAVRKYIRAVPGLSEGRLLMENPGTPSDPELIWYAETGPDVVFVSEEPYHRFVSDEVQQRLADVPCSHVQSGFMISGVARQEIVRLTLDLCRRGSHIFVTDLVDNFYESFGDSWEEFVAAFDRD